MKRCSHMIGDSSPSEDPDANHPSPSPLPLLLGCYRHLAHTGHPPSTSQLQAAPTKTSNDLSVQGRSSSTPHTPYAGTPSSSAECSTLVPEPPPPFLSGGLPLTADNLGQLEASGSSSSSPTSTSHAPSSMASDSNESKTHTGIFEILKRHRIYINDDGAKKRHASFLETVKQDILKNFRSSRMSDSRKEEIRVSIKQNRYSEEIDLLKDLWVLLVDKTRNVPLNLEGPKLILDKNERSKIIEWIEQAWERDHLTCRWDKPFKQGSVPQLPVTGNLALDIILDTLPKVKNAKPDLVYGSSIDAFIPWEQAIILKLFPAISDEVYDAFFRVDAKSSQGHLAEAEFQTARSGSAASKSKRGFDDFVDGRAIFDFRRPNAPIQPATPRSLPVEPTADKASMSFGLAVDPNLAIMVSSLRPCQRPVLSPASWADVEVDDHICRRHPAGLNQLSHYRARILQSTQAAGIQRATSRYQ